MTVLLTSGPTQAGEKHTKNNNKQTKPRFMSAQQVSPLHIGNCPQPRTEIKTKEKQVTVLLTSDLHISPTQAGWRGKKKKEKKEIMSTQQVYLCVYRVGRSPSVASTSNFSTLYTSSHLGIKSWASWCCCRFWLSVQPHLFPFTRAVVSDIHLPKFP